ncbi:MAG: hypothetical protein ACXVA9_11370 [Bdellovibrionales bacterium]
MAFKGLLFTALTFGASFANAMTMQITNVTGIHLEKSGKDLRSWLVSFDSSASGQFRGSICTVSATEDSIREIFVAIDRAEQENLGLDLTLYIERNLICLQAARVSPAQ